MLKRIVKLTFREEAVPEFIGIFEESKLKIRAFEGCCHLELLRDVRQPNVFFTISLWENESSLNHYRQSRLFQNTWEKTKVLFAERAEAWSLEIADTA